MAETLRDLLTTIAAAAVASEPLPSVFSHGDFTHSQLLTGGGRCGLVDFDSIARAEPALDLGQFLAYLRMALAKAEPAAGRDRADRLADRFLTAYVDAADIQVSADVLRARARVYETISLLRSTVHAWQKLKAKRARLLFSLLDEQVARLPLPD
jgi:aminoglycoside phosphotransferase (APT) family kinase protein